MDRNLQEFVSHTDASDGSSHFGFGNHFGSEALPGALPRDQNSPQRCAYGLYAEQLSGSAFTAPRAENRRTWTYRIQPSVCHQPYRPTAYEGFLSGPFARPAQPAQLRWNPFDLPMAPTDFVDGVRTIGGNGEPDAQFGMAIHIYAANRSMTDRVFCNADGELLIVPQAGSLRLFTELGILTVAPGEIALVPAGLHFRAELPDGPSSGYIGENYGAMLRLPELGPIGANGLANPRHFQAPTASFEDRAGSFELITKLSGAFWVAELDHSPLNVVAWQGNLVPYAYDLAKFMTIGTVSFDHADPSIFTVLTSPSARHGTANLDFVVLPPRWLVAEHSFRPPWFHRNAMSECMGLIRGMHEAKGEGFVPGGLSLHNRWSAHGPDEQTTLNAQSAMLEPQKLDSLAFMFETRYPIRVTDFALNAPQLQNDYHLYWQGLTRNRVLGERRAGPLSGGL
jgi:homogentisate 1,2-dioxygenase